MAEKFNRLRAWTEQGNVAIPQLFLKYYKDLKMTDDEALILIHLLSFHSEGIDFPTPSDLSQRLQINDNEVSMKLQRLMQKGFLEISQGVDANGKLTEKFSIYPLWQRILDHLEMTSMSNEKVVQKNEEGEIFSIFEQEFGRLLSPMELETISMWLDTDHHSPAIIKAALKEAVLAGKVSLRYIDRILFEWKKKNITSIKQVEKHSEQFHKNIKPVMNENQNKNENTQKVSFYNWLEERE